MEYLKNLTLQEACDALKSNKNARVLAGGTDLLVHKRHKRCQPDLVVDIKYIDMLKHIRLENDFLHIGACVTINELIENPIIKEKFNVLSQAAKYIACHQIRNRATIGGNICNASPAADMSPPLYCLDAVLSYYHNENRHEVKVIDFFKGPGKTVLPEDGILCEFKIPASYQNSRGAYKRHSRRKSLDLSSVGACAVKLNEKYTIALGSVAPTVIRVADAEEVLNNEGLTEATIEKASIAAYNTAKPISDLRASREYRKEMVKVYVSKVLKALLEESS
jgi:carbon-monoxide dehydrogenase medium subunit